MLAMLCSCAVQAQLSLKRLKYDSIAARYSNEHAVFTEVTCTMTIKLEDGELVASSNDVVETLFLSEKSLNTYNVGDISGGYFAPLTDVDGKSFIPEGNDYKVVRNSMFRSEGGLYYSGLTKNSITRTSYSNDYRNVRLLFPFKFEYELPTVKAKFELTAPDYVNMRFALMGVDTNIIKKTVRKHDGVVTYTFIAENVPAYRPYDFVPSTTYFVAHVMPSVVSFRLVGAKNDSMLSGSTDVHHKFEYSYVKGINYTTDSSLNKKVAELTKYAYSDRDKAEKIYNWVQKNMHYISLDYGMEGLIPRPADTVFKRRYGDCKDMTSLITAMCKKAGVSAYFAVIGSNSKPYTHEQFQSEYLYDHMIGAMKVNGDWVFLDGTTDNMPFGYNRKDLQGKEAYIMIDENNYKVVKIPETPATENVHTDRTTININGNDINGAISQHYTGYAAWDLADAFDQYERDEERDRVVEHFMKRGNSKFIIDKYDVNVSTAKNKTTTINAKYKLGDYVHRAGRQVYVNLNLKNTLEELRVSDDDRKVPVYLKYKRNYRETVTLNVPDGYRITHVPKGASGGVDGLWTYKLSYETDRKNNTVTLTKELNLNTMKITPEQFDANNKLVNDLVKEYKETVVLTAK